MTSKDRAKLKGIAANCGAVLQLGKNPMTPQLIKQASDALKARELIKISVLESCAYSPSEAAEILSGETSSEIVQVIGRKIVLFKKRPKSDKKPSLLADGGAKNAKEKSK